MLYQNIGCGWSIVEYWKKNECLWMLLLLFDSFSSVRRALLGEEDN
jgi:hypothetical protein